MTLIKHLRRASAVAAVLAAAFTVAPASAQMTQVPLTSASVEAVIASYPAVKQTAEALEAQYGNIDDSGDPGAAWGAWLAVGGAHGALNSSVQSYGFADFPTWVATVSSVAMAYGFAEQGGNDSIDAQMAEALAQIQNNPNLTDAQKEMMLQQMQASMGAVAMIRPSEENVAAVAPYIDQLKVLFDD